MSIHLSAQVWDLALSPEEKLILLAYADGANEWPPQRLDLPLLARKTGYSEQVITTVLHRLGTHTALLTGER